MKTAIYIEDGTVQLVITPESEFEKNALASFYKTPFEAKFYNGSFYECSGGWVRQSRTYESPYGNETDKSLILRIKQDEESE